MAGVEYTLTVLQTNAATANVKRSTEIKLAGGGALDVLRGDLKRRRRAQR